MHKEKNMIMNKDKYEGYKIIKLEPEYTNYYDSSWNTVGIIYEYRCPICEYYGDICDKCRGEI